MRNTTNGSGEAGEEDRLSYVSGGVDCYAIDYDATLSGASPEYRVNVSVDVQRDSSMAAVQGTRQPDQHQDRRGDGLFSSPTPCCCVFFSRHIKRAVDCVKDVGDSTIRAFLGQPSPVVEDQLRPEGP